MGVQLTAFPVEYPPDPNKQVVRTGERFERLLRFLESRSAFVLDYETSGLRYFRGARAVGVGLASWDDQGRLWNAYVPFRHATGEPQLDLSIVGPALKRLLANDALKIGHNIKFEDHFSRAEGWQLLGPRYDTMVAGRLHDENRGASLDVRAREDLGDIQASYWVGELNQALRDLARFNRMGIQAYKEQYGYSEVAIALLGRYCCTDTDQTGRLYTWYEQRRISTGHGRIWKTEMRLTDVLCTMEENGLPIDVPYLREVQRLVVAAREDIGLRMQQMLGGMAFNPGSDPAVRSLLQDYFGIKLEKETAKHQAAVDQEVLEGLAESNYLCRLLLQWREAEKIASTYTESLLKTLDVSDVMHGNFQSVGTNTGRLSCREPNQQNFPTDDDARAVQHSGKKLEDGGIDPWSVQRAFVVRPGMRRLFFDYSQVELRMLTYYSHDPVMWDAYLRNQDIHARTASEIGAVARRECPRRVAKMVNFGLSYGLSASGLSRRAKVSLADATLFMDAFFQRYVGIPRFRQWLCTYARQHGCEFTNIFGRTRHVPLLNASVPNLVKRAERQLIGSVIQGTAAELTKESLVRLDDWIKAERLPVLLVNTVHDEIQIDCPVEYEGFVVRGVKQIMERFAEFDPIPIIVDASVTSTSWASKRKYEGAK